MTETTTALEAAKPSVPQRWHGHRCSRCKTTITVGTQTVQLYASTYAPMQPGPEWEAEGDWSKPLPLSKVLCPDCLRAVKLFAMGLD